jgi:two-component system NtrC family sensor kinase
MVSRVIDSGDQEERPAQSDVALQTTDAHETELEKAQRMLRMVCRCNQVLFRTTNKIELLNEICASAVKEGGYLMAWIGLAGPHDKSLVHPVAWYNVDKKYRESIIVRVAQSNQGKGPMGATLQTKAPTIAQNILNNPALESLHESASLMGYSSFVILPLTSKDRVIGLFKIYSAASNSFGQDELDSLVEIASDLSFGIEVIRTRKEVERVHASVMEEKQKADQYLNIAGVMLCVLDTTGKITTINDHGCALLEVSRSEAIGQNWFDNFLPQGQITPVKEVFRKLMAGEVSSVEYHENTIVTSHGAVKMVAFHNAVLTDKGGQITGILFSGEDISKRREIEVLRSQYRHIVDSSADMMALLSKEFTYLAVNRRYLDYLGKNYDDMVGKRVDEVLGEQYFNDVIRPAGLECMEGTDVTARSWHHVHSNGAIYMEVHYYPYYGADNEILGFAINGRDITSQFLLEEELKRRLEEIQTVLQSLPDLYFRLDLDGTLLEYGTPDESLLFAKPEFFIGKSILDVMPIAVAELFKNSLQSFSEGKNYASFDYEFPTPSGRSYFEARLRLMSNNQVILLVRDNSAQRSAEGETQRTWTELQHILDSANAVVIGVDNAGRVTEWNATVATLTGYSKKFALGKSCFEHFIAGAPEDKQGLQSMFKEIFNNTQSSITFKCFLRTKNKGDRLIYFGGTPRNDVEGNIIGLIGIGQDITELVAYQSNMEQKVLDRTRELHAIMTLSPDGYLLVDDNSEIIFVNRAFTEMTGLTIIKLTGLSLKEFGKLFYALCDPDEEKLTCAVDGTDAKCVCEDMFSCTNAIYTVVKMIRPAKRTISVSIKMNDEKNPGSKSKVLFFRDITHETEVD